MYSKWSGSLQFLTKDECSAFVNKIDSSDFRSEGDLSSPELQFDADQFLGRSFPLARMFSKLIGENQSAFLWITEAGIWPSFENMYLFKCLRAADHEFRQLFEAPGQIIAKDDEGRLVSYLQIIIISGWGGVLIGLENNHRLIISHDSWMSIRSQSDMSNLQKIVGDFGLPHRVTNRVSNTLAALHLPPYELTH